MGRESEVANSEVANSGVALADSQLAIDFVAAMRRTAAGVAIVTTRQGDVAAGSTVSSFTSLSAAPPSVLVCLNGESRTLDAIRENGFFAANVLSVDQDALAAAFSGGVPSDQRFNQGRWITLVTGAPVLEDALATFDCRVAKRFAFGTHHIVIGEVVAVRASTARPLVYHARQYGRFE